MGLLAMLLGAFAIAIAALTFLGTCGPFAPAPLLAMISLLAVLTLARRVWSPSQFWIAVLPMAAMMLAASWTIAEAQAALWALAQPGQCLPVTAP